MIVFYFRECFGMYTTHAAADYRGSEWSLVTRHDAAPGDYE